MQKTTATPAITWIILLSPMIVGMSLDLYSPSLPFMQMDLHTSHSLIKLTIALMALSIGFSQFFWGPIAQKLGHRRTLLVGFFAFFLFSALTFFVTNVYELLLLRALQGLAAGSFSMMYKMLISDFYSHPDQRKLSIWTAVFWGVSPILAPVIGSYVQHYYGWPYAFVLLALLTLIPFALTYRYLPRTDQKNKTQPFRDILKNYVSILCAWRFLQGAILVVVFNTATDTFGMLAPFLVQHQLHQSVIAYGRIALLFGVCLVAGILGNRFFLHIQKQTMCRFASGLMLLGTGLLCWFGLVGKVSVTTFLIGTLPVGIGLGFLMPNALAFTIASFPEKSAFVSASSGIVGIFVTGILTGIISFLPAHSFLHFGYVFLSFAGVACVTSIILGKGT